MVYCVVGVCGGMWEKVVLGGLKILWRLAGKVFMDRCQLAKVDTPFAADLIDCGWLILDGQHETRHIRR